MGSGEWGIVEAAAMADTVCVGWFAPHLYDGVEA